MRSDRSRPVSLALLVLAACGGSNQTAPSLGSSGGAPPLTPIGGAPSALAANVVPVTVNGSRCAAQSYLNKPCVSVTVCSPGTSTCQVIDDVLLDTGSFGLRIFKQALTVSLEQVSAGGGTLAECVQYGDGSSQWGPVKRASVILGGEPAVEVPIQVIDATFATVPGTCGQPDTDPTSAGATGVLGVGLFSADCGPTCALHSDNQMYYACTSGGCTGAAVPAGSQVQNPVALLSGDGNGVIVQLPSVPAGGTQSLAGQMVLGIGSRTNNVPSGVRTFAVDGHGDLQTSLDGGTHYMAGFLDTGSNGLFFPAPAGISLLACSGSEAGWYCPPSSVGLSAMNAGNGGFPVDTVSFAIGDFDRIINSDANVSAEAGGEALSAGGSGSSFFDWGLPFHFGKNVYVGFEGKSSALGTGPYFAY